MAVGTLRNVALEGVSYNVAADVAVTQILSKYEKAMIPTSGRAVMQLTKRIAAFEGIVLITTEEEADQLKLFAESTEEIQMYVVTAANKTYMAIGTIELENRETDTGRTTIQMLPNDEWVLFA